MIPEVCDMLKRSHRNGQVIITPCTFGTEKSMMPSGPVWILKKAHSTWRNTALTYLSVGLDSN